MEDLFIHYTLQKLSGWLDAYTPPESEHIPRESQIRRYELCHVQPDRKVKQGELTLSRSPSVGGNVSLRIECRRQGASGFSQFLTAELDCLNNTLTTPISWSYTTKLARSAQELAYLNSGLCKTMAVDDGLLTVSVNGRHKQMPLSGLYTCKWCLLDAVGRLKEQSTTSVNFTLIDEFDQIRGEENLSLRREAVAIVGGRKLVLRVYLLKGMGVIPTVYLCDESDVLLFAISGLEVYMLTDIYSVG